MELEGFYLFIYFNISETKDVLIMNKKFMRRMRNPFQRYKNWSKSNWTPLLYKENCTKCIRPRKTMHRYHLLKTGLSSSHCWSIPFVHVVIFFSWFYCLLFFQSSFFCKHLFSSILFEYIWTLLDFWPNSVTVMIFLSKSIMIKLLAYLLLQAIFPIILCM